MKYKIEKTPGTPAYLQLYEQLRQDIAGGILKPGTKLPSKRFLASELGLFLSAVSPQ